MFWSYYKMRCNYIICYKCFSRRIKNLHLLKLKEVSPSIQHLRTGAQGTKIITFCKFITKRVA